MSTATASIDHTPARRAYGWYVVMLLALCYVASFIDRMALAVLVEPVKAAFAISDTQLGLLFGASFAIVYALAGVPLGAVADRANRRNLILVGLLLWSVLTICSGFATSVLVLLVCRLGVAFGEAALTPSAVSMIADLFAPARRAAPMGVYLTSGLFGAAAAFIVCGALLASATDLVARGVFDLEPWRLTFIAVGLPGLVLAAVILLTVREPVRTGTQGERPTGGFRETLQLFAGPRRRFGLFFLAVAVAQMVPGSYAPWVPALLVREFGWTPASAGMGFGVAAVIACSLGQIVTPMIASRLYVGSNTAAFMRVGAVSALFGASCFACLPFVDAAVPMLVLLGATMAFHLGLGAMATVAVSLLAPNRERGRLIAGFLLMNSALAVALGPALIPYLAEHWIGGARPLTTAISLTGIASAVTAIALFLCSTAGFRQPWSAAEGDDSVMRSVHEPQR